MIHISIKDAIESINSIISMSIKESGLEYLTTDRSLTMTDYQSVMKNMTDDRSIMTEVTG